MTRKVWRLKIFKGAMQRIPALAVLGLLLLPFAVRPESGQPGAKRIFLLEDDKDGKWCGYSNEAAWKADAESSNIYVQAVVEYKGDRVSAVYITETDESGDWARFDHYSLSRGGQIVRLDRLLNVIPERVRQHQIFNFKNGKPIQESSTNTDPETGKPVDPSQHWVPEFPITANVDAFPFWGLLGSKRSEILSRGKACVGRNSS
jgi:hypothetical protein